MDQLPNISNEYQDDGRDDGRIYSRSYLTKMRIIEAMNHLCETTSFNKIHISDIVAESGVSRSNFYHNFESKNAAASWISMQCHKDGIFRIGRDLTWFEGHLITTRKMTKFRNLVNSAGECTDYDGSVPSFVRMRQINLRETIENYQGIELTDLLEFQIQAHPHTELVMATEYREGKLNYPLRVFCEYMISLTPRALYEALEHPVTRPPINPLI